MNSYTLCSRLSFLNAKITNYVKSNNQDLNTSLITHHLAESWVSQKCKSWEPLKKFEPIHNCGHRPTCLWAHFISEVPRSISGLFGFMPICCCSWFQSGVCSLIVLLPCQLSQGSPLCPAGVALVKVSCILTPCEHLLTPGLKMSYNKLLGSTLVFSRQRAWAAYQSFYLPAIHLPASKPIIAHLITQDVLLL